MSTQKLGPVDIEFVLKNVNFKQEAGKMRAEISGISETAKREVDETNRIMRTLGAGLGAYFSFQAIKGLGGELINVRGEFQQMGIALETMLGSKANADKLMAQVVDLSAKTPFSLTQVGQAAKQLLAYQVAQEEVIDTTTRLGNIAAGLSVPLDRLIMAYGQVKAKGKLMGDDLRQFTEAGIPMVSELANAFGVTQAEVYKLVETGKVGFEDVQKVIANLTDEGGMFFNLMEKQSKSLTGMVSNLGDAWDRMLNDIGQGNEGILAGSIQGLTSLVENYEKVIDVVKVITATYGAYKAAVALSTVATNGLTIAENLHYAALVIAEKAQKLLNMTSLANPYVALATVLTAVVGGLAIYSKWATEISEKSKVLSDVTSEVSTQLEHESSILEVYKRRIEQTNPGSRERVRLVKELNEKYPDLLKNVDAENASIETLSKTFNSYITGLEKTIRLKTLESKLSDIITEKQNLETQFREKAISANERYEQSQKLDERRNILIEELQYQKDLVDYGQKNADLLKEKKKLEMELASIPSLANEFRTKPQTFDEFKAMQMELANAAESAGRPFKSSLEDIKKAYDEYVKSINATNQDYESKVARIEEINKLLKNGLIEEPKKTSEEGKDKKDKITAKVGIWGEKEALEKDLQDFATYQDKRLSIIEKYSQSRQRLQEQGYDEQAAEASAQMQKELDDLDASQFKKSESYRWVYDSIDKMGRKALQDYIARLKKEIDAFKGNEEVKLELTKRLAEAEEKQKDYVPEKLKESADILSNMAELAGAFNTNLGESIKLAADLASNLSTAMSQLASGNYIGGIMTGVAAIVSIQKTIDRNRERKEEEASQKRQEYSNQLIQNANYLLERQLELLDKINGTQIYQGLINSQEALQKAFTDSQKAMENLNLMDESTGRWEWERRGFLNMTKVRTLKFDQFRFDELNELMGEALKAPDYENISAVYDEIARIKSLIAGGSILGDTKALEEQLANYESMLQQAEELAAKQAEILTGSTYDSVVDALASAFDDGIFSAEEFAKSFQQMMQDAALNSLKINALKGPLEAWYKEFANLSEGGLTADEVRQLREGYMTIASNAGQYFENLKDITGITFDSLDESGGGLSGAIKGMSQESADLLAGQLGAMRIHLADIASVVTGGFNSDLRLDTADMEQSFGLGLNAINNAILQSNDYLRQVVQNTASIEEMKNILAGGITIKGSRGFDENFKDRRITGR